MKSIYDNNYTMTINIQKFKGDLDAETLQKLSQYPELFIDCEATGLKLKVRDRLSLVSISSGSNDCFIVQPSKEYQCKNLVSLLTNGKIAKCGHYLRFDYAALSHFLKCEIKGELTCTKIMSKIARGYASQHGLKELIAEFANTKIKKDLGSSTDWSQDIDLLSQAQLTYCANDVIFLKKIKEELLKILIREGRENLYKQTIKWLPVRVQLDLAGYSDTDLFSHS